MMYYTILYYVKGGFVKGDLAICAVPRAVPAERAKTNVRAARRALRGFDLARSLAAAIEGMA